MLASYRPTATWRFPVRSGSRMRRDDALDRKGRQKPSETTPARRSRSIDSVLRWVSTATCDASPMCLATRIGRIVPYSDTCVFTRTACENRTQFALFAGAAHQNPPAYVPRATKRAGRVTPREAFSVRPCLSPAGTDSHPGPCTFARHSKGRYRPPSPSRARPVAHVPGGIDLQTPLP